MQDFKIMTSVNPENFTGELVLHVNKGVNFIV